MRLFSLHREDGAFFIIPEVHARLDSRPVAPGEHVAIWNGTTVWFGGTAVVLGLPDERLRVALRRAGQGGEIRVYRRDKPVEVYPISARRTKMLDALLSAPELPDDHLIRLLWPGHAVRTRLDLNQLVHRTRQDLSRAGLDEEMSLIRHAGGGSTALRLSEGCAVTGLSEEEDSKG